MSFLSSTRYNRSRGKFVVTQLRLEHQNHPVSADVYRAYPRIRYPSGDLAAEIDHMLLVDGKIARIAEALRQRGYTVPAKDLYNRRAALNKQG